MNRFLSKIYQKLIFRYSITFINSLFQDGSHNFRFILISDKLMIIEGNYIKIVLKFIMTIGME